MKAESLMRELHPLEVRVLCCFEADEVFGVGDILKRLFRKKSLMCGDKHVIESQQSRQDVIADEGIREMAKRHP